MSRIKIWFIITDRCNNINRNNRNNTNNIPLIEIKLAEWVGFNKYNDKFDYH